MLTHAKDAARRILAGECLLLAAEEEVLSSLPAGNWIGGTTPYFMAESGGTVSRDGVFVTPVPADLLHPEIRVYDTETLPGICMDTPENGMTFLILPVSSEVHVEFAQKAPNYDQMFFRPLMGWISGVHLDDLAWKSAKVFDGRTVSAHADKGVALHAQIAPGKKASLGIVNLFHQGVGDILTFPALGFHVKDCLVNGLPRNFAEYLVEQKIDTHIPLVEGCSGSNVSIQAVDDANGNVDLFAPVFPDMEYRIAQPVPDYLSSFRSALPKGVHTSFSCNCILNFLYSELEGKTTDGVTGPVTFGEIAYQLLNQTLVYLSIEDA